MAQLKVLKGGKSPTYECYFCQYETQDRETICPKCGQFDTLVRQESTEGIPDAKDNREAKHAIQLSLKRPKFYSSGSTAWDDVLGGGFVKPSSVLVYGSRGCGKSTSALQIALHLAHLTKGKALYGSAEMPAEHVRWYAERLNIPRAHLSRLWVQDSTDALDLLTNIEQLRPTVVIWDSIQRYTWEGDLGDVELRQVVCHAIDAGKHFRMISILLSQVSKEEMFLGPNGIGHDVDVMVRLSRQDTDLIVETPDKNRFAPTPRRASERFLAEVPERKPAHQIEVVTIENDQATTDWFASSHVPPSNSGTDAPKGPEEPRNASKPPARESS